MIQLYLGYRKPQDRYVSLKCKKVLNGFKYYSAIKYPFKQQNWSI